MTKFFGKIGYAMTQETKPGVWMDQIMEREYYGDLLRNSYRFQTSDKVNDDVSIANEFSIIADSFAKDNFHLRSISSLRVLNGKSQMLRLGTLD